MSFSLGSHTQKLPQIVNCLESVAFCFDFDADKGCDKPLKKLVLQKAFNVTSNPFCICKTNEYVVGFTIVLSKVTSLQVSVQENSIGASSTNRLFKSKAE